MKFTSLKQIIASVMAVTIISATSLVAYAADVTGTQDNNASGSGSTVPIVAIAEAPIFKVVVPLSLPISIDANGNVPILPNATITNLSSYGTVVVNKFTITGTNEWTLFNYNSDFGAMKVNSKHFGFCLIPRAYFYPDSNGNIINPGIICTIGQPKTFYYSMKIAPQSTTLNAESIANAVVIVGWYT